MQCLFAANRDIPQLAALLDPYAPVLFRLLHQVADKAEQSLPKIRLCGLLPQVPGILPILIGLGFRCFSVEPVWLTELARSVRQTHSADAAQLARKVCGAADSASVSDLLGQPANRPGDANQMGSR